MGGGFLKNQLEKKPLIVPLNTFENTDFISISHRVQVKKFVLKTEKGYNSTGGGRGAIYTTI